MATVYALVLAFASLLSALSTLPADAREWRSWCGTEAAPLGWHFYCDRGEEEDEKEEAPQTQASPPPSATERILSTRRALEEARARAILEPSAENVTAYLALQQEALQSAATLSAFPGSPRTRPTRPLRGAGRAKGASRNQRVAYGWMVFKDCRRTRMGFSGGTGRQDAKA